MTSCGARSALLLRPCGVAWAAAVLIAWAGGFIMLWLYGTEWFLDFSLLGTNMRELFQVKTINLSVAVWVGFLALFGIASDDGVVIASYLDESFRKDRIENAQHAREATVAAGLRRVRPCLMTTATTILALVPILTSTGRGSDIMVPMGGTDEWVANIASYVRNSFGNNAGMVTPADVARVRDETAARKAPWTLPELEATLPRLLDSQQWKMTASHGGETAAGASSLRGWSSGVPQAQGMWFTVELPQAVTVTEVQFESAVSSGRGGGGGRAAGRGGPGGSTPPVVGFPRSYTVEVSPDGRTWSRPVAEGRGGGPRTSIRFAPVRAKFVRLTQTGSEANAPAWSIRNLRIYEAPGMKK